MCHRARIEPRRDRQRVATVAIERHVYGHVLFFVPLPMESHGFESQEWRERLLSLESKTELVAGGSQLRLEPLGVEPAERRNVLVGFSRLDGPFSSIRPALLRIDLAGPAHSYRIQDDGSAAHGRDL